jgi:riboflavin kinase/FMN adenylyltransferase
VLNGERFEAQGALYFGDCPTFGNRDIHFEFHMLWHRGSEPVEHEQASLWLHKHIRGDVRFNEEHTLKKQIEKDISTIQQYFLQER